MTMCWLYRIWRTLKPGHSAARLQALRDHLATCRGCRSLEAQDKQLERDLTTGASGVRVRPPPFLARRIVLAIEHDTPPASPIARDVRWLAPAALLACVGFIAYYLMIRDDAGYPVLGEPLTSASRG